MKWVRDKAKSAYTKKLSCYICKSTQDLELHHTHSITLLLNNWALEHNYDISTDEGILLVRDKFIAEHNKEIYADVYTLCNPHHVALHSVYGKAPPLSSTSRQSEWIENQKAKFVEGYVPEAPVEKVKSPYSPFAEFY